MVPNAIDPLTISRCALYTAEVIRSIQHADWTKNDSGPNRYGKCKVIVPSVL
jgi:hypothetical protein